MSVDHPHTPTEVRLRLFERGHCPLPLEGKNPEVNGKGWQHKRQQTNADEIRLWASVFPHALNTGVLSRLTPFLDIDILNPDAAQAIEDLIAELFDGHYVLTRFGKSPKRAIPFQTTAPFAKISAVLVAPGGSEERVEFLADGQQCVVHGTHPEAQRPYSWHGAALWDIPRDGLPSITAETAQRLLDAIAELLVNSFGYQRRGARSNGGKAYTHFWRSNDYDWPCSPTGVEDRHETEGRIYAQVRSADGTESFVPKDELIPAQVGNGAAGGWPSIDELIDHDKLCAFAMRLLKSGMQDGAVVNMLRAMVLELTNVDKERRDRRLFEIPAMVSSARAKIEARRGEFDQDADGPLRQTQDPPTQAPRTRRRR
jgi:hypothetical protein